MAVHPHPHFHLPRARRNPPIHIVLRPGLPDRASRERAAALMIGFCTAAIFIVTLVAIAAFVFDANRDRLASQAAEKVAAEQAHLACYDMPTVLHSPGQTVP